jgi:hypothetical protein
MTTVTTTIKTKSAIKMNNQGSVRLGTCSVIADGEGEDADVGVTLASEVLVGDFVGVRMGVRLGVGVGKEVVVVCTGSVTLPIRAYALKCEIAALTVLACVSTVLIKLFHWVPSK